MTARNYCEAPLPYKSEHWNFAWGGSTEAFMQRSEKLSNDGSRTPALGTSTHDQENNA